MAPFNRPHNEFLISPPELGAAVGIVLVIVFIVLMSFLSVDETAASEHAVPITTQELVDLLEDRGCDRALEIMKEIQRRSQ